MIRLWFALRHERRSLKPRRAERQAMETYLRSQGVMTTPIFADRPVVRLSFAVATVVLIACVSLGSYAYASDNVLPDTPLYPMRQAVESAELSIAQVTGREHVVFHKLIERRKQEVQMLQTLHRPIPASHKKIQEFMQRKQGLNVQPHETLRDEETSPTTSAMITPEVRMEAHRLETAPSSVRTRSFNEGQRIPDAQRQSQIDHMRERLHLTGQSQEEPHPHHDGKGGTGSQE